MINYNKKFDPTGPCLVLAPHLEYPLRNGGDILIDKKWSEFSKYVQFVDIIGKNTITRYRKAKLEERRPYDNISISQYSAAIRTVLLQSHYLLEKFMTLSFIKTAHPYLQNPKYKTVIFSFIWSASILDSMPKIDNILYCIETHNDEIKWFDDLRKTSVNPLVKLTAYFSRKWLRSFLHKHEADFLYLHVSKADQSGYLKYFPYHSNHIVPIGADTDFRDFSHITNVVFLDKIRLIFVGSLGARMNLDAINVFRTEYYSLLKKELNGNLEVFIVGSNPSRNVIKICSIMGWKLYPNVSDSELMNLYNLSMFSILPFHYVNGGKLKILKSLANGVPYLATDEILDQVDEVLYPCLISTDPKEWLTHISNVQRKGITRDDRIALMKYAKKYSWSTVAYKMYQLLSQGS